MLTLASRLPGPVIHAAEVALEVIVITAGCLASAGLVTVAAVVAVRLRRRQLAARMTVRTLPARPAQAISAPRPRAIVRPAVGRHGMSAEDVRKSLR
jgi:hypothetical protein